MKEKALKYTIILLLIPLTASLIIAIITNSSNKNVSGNMNDGEIPDYNNKTVQEQIRSTDTYMYISVFTLCAATGVILMYIKNKRGI